MEEVGLLSSLQEIIDYVKNNAVGSENKVIDVVESKNPIAIESSPTVESKIKRKIVKNTSKNMSLAGNFEAIPDNSDILIFDDGELSSIIKEKLVNNGHDVQLCTTFWFSATPSKCDWIF